MSWVRCVVCNNHFAVDKKAATFCEYCGGRLTSEPLVIEDRFREKYGGWKGEMSFYRLANEQHKKTHVKADVDCEICMAITRGMARLIDEGKEMEMKKDV